LRAADGRAHADKYLLPRCTVWRPHKSEVNELRYGQRFCARALSSAIEAADQSGTPIATFFQVSPHGLSLLSRQVSQWPAPNWIKAKSARAGVVAANPSANRPIAKANNFIVSSCCASPGTFGYCAPDCEAKPRPAVGVPQAARAGSINKEEEDMPEVVVYMLEGRSLEQKRGLIKDITAAVVKNAGTTAEQVTVSLVETAKTAKGKGGVLFSEMPSR
jgi:4-oxalocrotonate tautomerase